MIHYPKEYKEKEETESLVTDKELAIPSSVLEAGDDDIDLDNAVLADENFEAPKVEYTPIKALNSFIQDW
jgi:hypothetical protein